MGFMRFSTGCDDAGSMKIGSAKHAQMRISVPMLVSLDDLTRSSSACTRYRQIARATENDCAILSVPQLDHLDGLAASSLAEYVAPFLIWECESGDVIETDLSFSI